MQETNTVKLPASFQKFQNTVLLVTLKVLLKLLLLWIFLHQKVKKFQNITKEIYFRAPGRVLTFLLTLCFLNTHICVFLDYIRRFFGSLLLLLEIKIKLIKFCIKLYVKQGQFLPSKFTIFLFRSKAVQRNCLHLFKIFIIIINLFKVDAEKSQVVNLLQQL